MKFIFYLSQKKKILDPEKENYTSSSCKRSLDVGRRRDVVMCTKNIDRHK